MMIKVLLFSWFATLLVTADTQLHLTNTEDLQSIVESIKQEIDQHIQLRTNSKQLNLDAALGDELTTTSKSSSTILHDAPVFNRSAEATKYSSDNSEYYGSVKGVPGVNFPDYTDIPRTSFSCSDKIKFPGFYADMDTGCQVFHVCWPDRRESFLCPMGTIFNQAILACDYWYNSNCSLASLYYATNSELEYDSSKSETGVEGYMINTPVQKSDTLKGRDQTASIMFFVSEFMPIKAKIVVYPQTEKQRQKIVASASIGQDAEKLKSRRKSSKRLRIPRSLEYQSSSETKMLSELKSRIMNYRKWEAFNNFLKEIQNDQSYAHLAPYVEALLKIYKYIFHGDKSPEMVNYEPGTALHEYDVKMQADIKKITFFNEMILKYLARTWYEYNQDRASDLASKQVSENDELEALKPTPVTHFDPTFDMKKPAVEENLVEQGAQVSADIKMRTKRATDTGSHHENFNRKATIYPETKEALLKSYVELYNTKYA